MTYMPGANQLSISSSGRDCSLHFNRWHGLSAAMVIMGCSGLTYTYAVYSDHLKVKFHYTQEQIDNIGAAKDFGSVLGVASGIFYNYYPPWVTVCIGALMHLFGYGLMWVTTIGDTASIWLLSFYVALGTGGDSWVDTACMMSSLQNFGDYRGTTMGILKSQLGLSGAMFVNIYQAFLQPSVDKFLLFISVVPTVLYLIMSFFIRPLTKNKDNDDDQGTSLLFKIIYCIILLLAIFLTLTVLIQVKFHPGRSTMVLLSVIMLFIVFVMYTVPSTSRNLISKLYTSSMHKSEPQEIDLEPISMNDTTEATYLEGKSESFSLDSGTESIPLENGIGISEPVSSETREADFIFEQKDVHNADNLTIWGCLLAIDFWLVNFVVVSGAGSGLAIINNFAQIGTAAKSKDVSLFVNVISVGSCLGRLTSGYVSDYLLRKGFSRPICLLGTQAIMTISCLMLATGGVFFLYISAALIGMAYGAYWTLSPAVLSELFGVKHFATLYKVIGICPTIGSYILSAKILGAFYDQQTILYQQSSKEKVGEGICYGQQCFGFALMALSSFCSIGVLASLWLVRRTQRLYNRKYHLLSSSTI